MLYRNQHSGLTWQERFWEKVNKNGPIPEDKPELGPCWVWTASTDKKGYGFFRFNGGMRRAHKFIYEQEVGPIPPGKQCDHLCRNHSCVNYEKHIEPVTPRENTIRGFGLAAFCAFQTHCKRGHPFSKENTYWTKTGKRGCRECSLEYSAYWYRKKTEGKVAHRRASKRTAYHPGC